MKNVSVFKELKDLKSLELKNVRTLKGSSEQVGTQDEGSTPGGTMFPSYDRIIIECNNENLCFLN
jgi:hypothetical protein